MTLRLSSSHHRGSRQIHRSRKKRVKFASLLSPCWSFFLTFKALSTRNSYPLVKPWGFEVAEGGHSVQMSRQVEEKQLVSPPWQLARSHITRSTIPDFQKHYSDSPPQFAWPHPLQLFPFPEMKLRLEGRNFDRTEEIHAETQEVIDTFTFENFQGCVKSRETRWDLCIHAQGDYFEGDGN